ncbi:MAG: histidine kinase [Arthrobacter sp.]|jgi:signal transduction histidine kinase|nr:histidine kinase [Arthrobacter sp.]
MDKPGASGSDAALPVAGAGEPITRSRNPLVNVGRATAVWFLALWNLVLWVLIPSVFALCLVWVGVILLRPLAALVRGNARLHRRLARRWSGVEVAEQYLDLPGKPGIAGSLGALRSFKDPTVIKDWVWTLAGLLVGVALCLLPLALVGQGVWQLVAAALWDPLNVGSWDTTLSFIHTAWPNARLYLALTGVLFLVLGLAAGGAVLTLHARWVRLCLATGNTAALRRRLAAVEDSRRDAVQMQAEEVARIERDLHDGAQARLVALGMTLGRAERLMQTDPERAQELMRQAQTDSSGALEELRQLVRGIRPPVLADRGVAGALRSLASSLEVPTTVTEAGELGELPEVVESALYFAGAELMTNAVKHARASSIAVTLGTFGAAVRLEVLDDGAGPGVALAAGGGPVGAAGTPGADADAGVLGVGSGEGTHAGTGTGLAGLRRRLAALDGVLELSDAGGRGTRASVTIPLAVS